jgi:hypothetical protein
MKLRLKEDPREWRKFGLNSALALALITGLLCWRAAISTTACVAVLAVLALSALLAMARPDWFRRPYRLGMRISHWMGRLVAPVVLGLIFFLVVTPLGLLLRLLGKDLLRLRRDPSAASYWQATTGSDDLTKMF